MKNERNLFCQLANMTNECVIGCDFSQDRFLFVPESDYRLLPASSYVSLSESFPQMKAYIHPDDQHWVEQLFSVMKEKLEDPDLDLAQMDHFAWQLRVKCTFKQVKEYIMLYVKFKPFWEQKCLHYGIFVITLSVERKQTFHLYLHNINRGIEVYHTKVGKWKHYCHTLLTDQQIVVVVLAQLGFSSKEIAEILFLSTKRINKIKAIIYEVLQVKSIEQAIQIITTKQLWH